MNLPSFLIAYIGRNENRQPLQSSLTSVHGGRQPSTNMGGNLPLMNGNSSLGGTSAQYPQGGYVPHAFAISNVPPYNGLGYTDDTLQILGLHEEQRILGFVHGLRTRKLVEFLSTYLPTTYKGLMEKTYTWIEAREVATNGALNDRREVSTGQRRTFTGTTT
ncbi:hypothetical protein Tco_0212136 [Tanacetum coccineum]